jgi:hypothetical protein
MYKIVIRSWNLVVRMKKNKKILKICVYLRPIIWRRVGVGGKRMAVRR